MDELTIYRQHKCGQSKEGHQWSYPEDGLSTCQKCGVIVRRSEKRPNA